MSKFLHRAFYTISAVGGVAVALASGGIVPAVVGVIGGIAIAVSGTAGHLALNKQSAIGDAVTIAEAAAQAIPKK